MGSFHTSDIRLLGGFETTQSTVARLNPMNPQGPSIQAEGSSQSHNSGFLIKDPCLSKQPYIYIYIYIYNNNYCLYPYLYPLYQGPPQFIETATWKQVPAFVELRSIRSCLGPQPGQVAGSSAGTGPTVGARTMRVSKSQRPLIAKKPTNMNHKLWKLPYCEDSYGSA